MKALVQRVLQAEVRVEGASVGAIGVLLFLGIEQGDGAAQFPAWSSGYLGLVSRKWGAAAG